MAGNPNPSAHDDNAFLWVAGGGVALLLAFWWLIHPFFADALLAERRLVAHIMLWIDAGALDPRLALQMRAGYAPSEWTLHNLNRYALLTAWAVNPLLLLGVGWFAWRRAGRNPAGRMRRRFTNVTLPTYLAPAFPWTLPALWAPPPCWRGKRPPGKPPACLVRRYPIDSGPWRMARRPLELARDHGMLHGLQLQRETTEAFYRTQMGSLWGGLERLPRHQQALLGVFVAQILGAGLDGAPADPRGEKDGRKIAKQLLSDLVYYHTRAWQPLQAGQDEPAVAWARAGVRDPRIQAMIGGHAYVHTVLMRLLFEARRFGVLNPALYLWLRVHDKPLWYSLHNVGRTTPFPESAATFQHWRAEMKVGRALLRPHIDGLYDAMKKAIDDVDFMASDLDAAGTKKSGRSRR